MKTTRALKYTGPTPAEVGVVPLPEGWPAFDHEEPDEDVRNEKVASGVYALGAAGTKEEPDGNVD